MVLKKVESETGYDINIKLDEGIFKLYYGGNGDLYWTFWPHDYEDDKISYVIEVPHELLPSFNDLYNDVINATFSSRSKDLITSDEHKLLCQNGIICWHSDEQPYEDANCVSIIKQKDDILVKFDFLNKDFSLENSIRFRTRGSRYTPFHQAFMKHFQTVCDIEILPEYQRVKTK